MRKHLALLSLSLLSVSPMVLGQSYSGSVGVLNTIFEPPMNINNILCDPGIVGDAPHAYKACSEGVSAARWMAEKYAQNTGKFLGCVDGFYQGMWDGYTAGMNPTPAMLAEAENYVKNVKFTSAEQRGEERARAEGRTESADQIIKRYRAVIGLVDNTGAQVLPDKSYQFPEITFKGFDDGYEFDILKTLDMQKVYELKWVSSSSPFADKIAARKAHMLQGEYAKSFCSIEQTVFGRQNMPAPTIWDYFSARRKNNFQMSGWNNPDWAWQIFDRDERTLEHYQSFARLRTLEKTVTEAVPVYENRYKLDAEGNPIKKLDAAGQPVLEGGRPVFEMEKVIIRTDMVTKKVRLSDGEILALENLYKKNFKVAYDTYYARQYASKSYNSEGMDKYTISKTIGKLIGEDVAQQVAKRNSYNKGYEKSSAVKYAAKVESIYKDSFDRLIGIFQDNAVLELNETFVMGETRDAIFRPGENLNVRFTVTNLGERDGLTNLSFANSMDMVAKGSFPFTVPALARAEYVTGTLGEISKDKFARDRINVNLNLQKIGDLHEVARSLVVRKDHNILLNDYVEIEGVTGNLDHISGGLNVLVNVKNPSEIESPIAIVEVNFGAAGTVEKNIEPLGRQSVRTVSLNINNLDPMAIIASNTLSGVVNVKLANRTVHRQNVSFRVNQPADDAILKYFDSLATGKNTNVGRMDFNDRMAELQTALKEYVMRDIRKEVKWNDEKQMKDTFFRKIQNAYDESKRANRMNAAAQAQYQALGQALVDVDLLKSITGPGVFFTAKKNRESYLIEVSKFAPKIEKNLKKYNL